MQRIVGPRQTCLFDPCDPALTEAYCFCLNVQYALNLEPVAQDLSVQSLERYIAYFEQDNLAEQVLREDTGRLVEVPGSKGPTAA